MNQIRTKNGLRITWIRTNSKKEGDKLNFTLHGPNKEIGKASLTADQIAGYILRKNGFKSSEELGGNNKNEQR